MKKLIIAISMIAVSLMAVDYSQMTMDQLNDLRGTVAVEDREAFRSEMQSRVSLMTPDEQVQFRAERMANKGAGLNNGSGSMNRGSTNQGQGMGQRLRDGSGAGSMSQGASGNNGNCCNQGNSKR